jgi:hypothetical protein
MSGLILSKNSKTSYTPNHNNTFGLSYGLPENGGTCPGATTGNGGCCAIRDGKKRQTCYVAKITAIYKNVGNVLLSNTALLSGKTVEEMKNICRETIRNFIDKNNGQNLYFRLHWSGDFFSEDYIIAWASVMKEFPQVRFWVYTRSYSHIDIAPLVDVKNLSLYLSIDPINYAAGLKIFEKYKDVMPSLGLAWLGNDPPKDLPYKFIKCPETSGIVKNTKEAGACSKCRLCVDNYKIRIKNIAFNIH